MRFIQPIAACAARRESGASLLVALIMTALITMLGLSATQLALQSEKGSRNLRDRQIALESAQMALLDARNEIFGAGSRNALFSDTSAMHFSDDCNRASATLIGLCSFTASAAGNDWLKVPFNEKDAGARQYAEYGQFTGASMQTGVGSLTAMKPRYIIDVLRSQEMGRCADCPSEQKVLYRVTAVGFGVRNTTQVMLQAVFSKET